MPAALLSHDYRQLPETNAAPTFEGYLAAAFPRSELFQENGERGWNRTINLLIKSQLLCQLSYASTIKQMRATLFLDYHVDY